VIRLREQKKLMFQKQHYDTIAKLIGQKIVYGVMDDKDYRIVEAFAQVFAEDNQTFDKVRFRDAVYDAYIG
jgi:phage terminase large subunit